MERYVQPSDRVIDIGCGDGHRTAGWVAERSARYTGFDVSEGAVGLARANGLEAQLIADAAALPLESDSVDVALSLEVLEHLFDPFGAVVEARRVLRPGGILIVTVPNVANWRSRIDFALLGRWHPGGDDQSVSMPWRDPHIRFFTHRSLARMLSQAGYSIIEGGVSAISASRTVCLWRGGSSEIARPVAPASC
ncbi:MAG TPA: class I SAM-dependent methyltransferase [Solirubrobacteraceae bacterium]|nr:class I SAM-dependent methyltransferase [Solirubrobacteraceae bacterium]